jgi:PAS domain S-box-containing protein
MKRILLIDANVSVCWSLQRALRLKGFVCLAAEDGVTGLYLAREHKPDIILCDVQLVEAEGINLVGSLRNDPVTAEIPVILMSEQVDPDWPKLADADGHLTKPFSVTALLSFLETIPHRHRVEGPSTEPNPEPASGIVQPIAAMEATGPAGPPERKTEAEAYEIPKEAFWPPRESVHSLVAENCSDLILLVGLDGGILYANAASYQLLNQPPEALTGKRLLDLVHPRDRTAFAQAFEEGLTGRQALGHFGRLLTAKGQGRPFESVLNWVCDAQNRVQAGVVIFRPRDLFSREEALPAAGEETLRELAQVWRSRQERERSRLAFELHHVLGQKLAAISRQFSDVQNDLRDCNRGGELDSLQDKLNELDRSLAGATDSLQRIKSQLYPRLLETLGLVPALEWQVQEFQNRTGLAGRFLSAMDQIKVSQDTAIELYRITQELLNNVERHAMATETETELKHQAGRVILKVHDNGKGIPADELENPKALGLAGLRERVRCLNGQIRFETAPQKGTTVTISVPSF